MTLLVTGGAGFIGANFVRTWLQDEDGDIVNLDKLTYAGHLFSLASLDNEARHRFVQGDILDHDLISGLLRRHRPRAIVNFAAESHVDRSIHGPEDFIQTNIVGSFRLLEAARGYWQDLPADERERFRFLHVSTDEVFGSLGPEDPAFSETTPYAPNSPYSASKAASDHLVRSYFHTYGLPVLTTNCSNNYGPYQTPEKLIPLMIVNALSGKPLPIYGDGLNVRDWLYVTDHCRAIGQVLRSGRLGETYNIGGDSEMTNLEVVSSICRILDELRPRQDGASYGTLVTKVKDRPGHDRRYAMDTRKISHELSWSPRETFQSGLRATIDWYLNNPDWIAQVTDGGFETWIELNYGAREAAK